MGIGIIPGELSFFATRFNGDHFPLVSQFRVVFNSGWPGLAV